MTMDVVGAKFGRIMNKDVNETFDQSTDSLEAIRDFLAAIMGFGPGVSLWMFGRCAAGMAASQTILTMDNLGTALPNDVFNGEFYVTVIHNANAPGAAPEGEWRRVADYVGLTQTFTTDAFTANVEATDLVIIAHESILFGNPLGRGTLDTSSATVPADSTRTEGNDYFNGALFMTTEGADRFQPRRIVDYTGAGGIFTLDPNNPLNAAPGLVDYVILTGQTEFVPPVDGINDRTPADVGGSKGDSGVQALSATSSQMRYIKGLVDMMVTATGITTWLARSKAGNGVSLSEAVRDIDELKPEWNARTSATHTTVSANEETILTTAFTTPGRFFFNLTLRNMVAGDDFTIRVYKRTDGANYDRVSEQQYLGNSSLDIYEVRDMYTDGTEFVRVTIQRASGTDRAFPYSYNVEKQAVA